MAIQTKFEIDATGRRLGRVATDAALHLQGKHRAEYARHAPPPVQVVITNASKLELTAKKRAEKSYVRYTGYPSGQRTTTLDELIATRGVSDALRKAVYGMLPDNKLRPRMMKRLIVIE